MDDSYRVLRWQAPTPAQHSARARRRSVFDDVAAELRGKPKAWAVIFEGRANRATGLTASINSGAHKCFRPAGSFEAVARVRRGMRTVYARYVGEEKP